MPTLGTGGTVATLIITHFTHTTDVTGKPGIHYVPSNSSESQPFAKEASVLGGVVTSDALATWKPSLLFRGRHSL